MANHSQQSRLDMESRGNAWDDPDRDNRREGTGFTGSPAVSGLVCDPHPLSVLLYVSYTVTSLCIFSMLTSLVSTAVCLLCY